MANESSDKQPAGSSQPGSAADQVVAQAAAKVADRTKTGTPAEKRPVGRPPKIKPESETAAGSPGAGGQLPAFDPSVVKRAVESLLRTTDRIIVRKVYGTCQELTQNQKRSQEMAADVALSPEELKTMPELAEICAKQYGLLGEHAPAILLGVMVTGYAARSLYALQQLREIAELNAKTKAAPAAAPSTAAAEPKIVAMPDANKSQEQKAPGNGN